MINFLYGRMGPGSRVLGPVPAEYAYTLKVDEKSDVYSFGVVLLELVSGRKPVGEFGDGVDIVQWVRKMTDSNKEEVAKILDPRLSTVPVDEVKHVFYVAMLCVEEQSVERPTMREVVQMLSEVPKTCAKQVEDPVKGDGEISADAAAAKESKEQQQRQGEDAAAAAGPAETAAPQQPPPSSSSSPPDLLSI